MSKARDEYLECLRIGILSHLVITTYVKELEAEKAESIEYLKRMVGYGCLSPARLSEKSDTIYHDSLELLDELQKGN